MLRKTILFTFRCKMLWSKVKLSSFTLFLWIIDSHRCPYISQLQVPTNKNHLIARHINVPGHEWLKPLSVRIILHKTMYTEDRIRYNLHSEPFPQQYWPGQFPGPANIGWQSPGPFHIPVNFPFSGFSLSCPFHAKKDINDSISFRLYSGQRAS